MQESNVIHAEDRFRPSEPKAEDRFRPSEPKAEFKREWIKHSEQSVELVSASPNDIASGTGAQSVMVEGFDANFNTVSEVVVTNGTCAVALSNKYMVISRADIVETGPNGNNEGQIRIQVAGGGEAAALIGPSSFIGV